MPPLFARVSQLLTYDFCPQFNRWVYWVKDPAASLTLAALAALACAVFIKPIAWLAFAAVMFVVFLGYLWPTIAVQRLSARLSFRQRRVSEGDVAHAVLTVVNRWPWPVWGISLEEGFGTRPTIALSRIGGYATAEFLWEFTPELRGEYPESPPRIVTGFPFGLRRAGRPVEVGQSLLVWPQIVDLDTLLDAAETRPSDDLFSETRAGESGDLTGTRPFRQGDSLRRVHWAQTARVGRMIVSERQAPTQTAVRVVFDSDPRLHAGSGTDSTLEWSIRLAASICAAYHRTHASVECCFGHEVLAIEPGIWGWQRFLDRLARWRVCSDVHEPGHHAQTGEHSPGEHSHGHHHQHNHKHGHTDDCEHEHTSQQCHKIHHHRCGAFQVTITTDVGLAHRTEHRHVHGDQRFVVLSTAGFLPDCGICSDEHPPPSRRAILLDHPRSVAADFQRKWRHACHVG